MAQSSSNTETEQHDIEIDEHVEFPFHLRAGHYDVLILNHKKESIYAANLKKALEKFFLHTDGSPVKVLDLGANDHEFVEVRGLVQQMAKASERSTLYFMLMTTSFCENEFLQSMKDEFLMESIDERKWSVIPVLRTSQRCKLQFGFKSLKPIYMDEDINWDDENLDMEGLQLKPSFKNEVDRLLMGRFSERAEREKKWKDEKEEYQKEELHKRRIKALKKKEDHVELERKREKELEEAEEDRRRQNDAEPDPNLNEEEDNPLITIDVRKVTSQDIKQKLKDSHVYDVKRRTRGRAIIISNELFHDERKNRDGTSFDLTNLDILLGELGYTTDVHCDKTAKQMVDIIAAESRHKDHKDSDSFILALFSHGAHGVVYGTDFKPVNVKETIMTAFDGHHCPALAGKPKLIIIQACQGSKSTEGVPVADAEDESQDELSLASALQRLNIGDGDQQDAVPWQPNSAAGNPGAGESRAGEMERGAAAVVQEKGDMLVAYSTVSGYTSWRLPDKGSWFIRTLVKVFMYHAKTDHVVELLTRVRNVVSQKRTTYVAGGLNVQMTQNDDTLTKKWYLFPGYNPPQ